MNFFEVGLAAFFAQTARPFNDESAHRPPVEAVPGGGPAASPAGVILTSYKLGLPLCHAYHVAKRVLGVEVAGRTGHALPAPRTCSGFLVPVVRWLTASTFCIAGRGAILRSALLLQDLCRADPTSSFYRFPESIGAIAQGRAKGLKWLTLPWVARPEDRTASFACSFHLHSRHLSILYGIEANEAYCEAAAKWLSQMPLEVM